MRHFQALFLMCHWFFVMLYLAGDHVVPSGQSPLYVTKSSDEGQIMLPSGEVHCTRQSPPMRGRSCCPAGEVHCTKQSPPMRGRSCWPSWSKSVVRDKVLRRGAHHVGLAGRSPLYVTKSSDEGHDLRGSHSQWRVTSCRILDHVVWHNILWPSSFLSL